MFALKEEKKKIHYIRQVPTHVKKIKYIPREKKPVKILRRTTTTFRLTNMWRQAIK